VDCSELFVLSKKLGIVGQMRLTFFNTIIIIIIIILMDKNNDIHKLFLLFFVWFPVQNTTGFVMQNYSFAVAYLTKMVEQACNPAAGKWIDNAMFERHLNNCLSPYVK